MAGRHPGDPIRSRQPSHNRENGETSVRDAHTSLAELRERLEELTGQPGRLADVLDVAGLSYTTGVPVQTVTALLAGREVPETNLEDRVRQRLDFLRETRRRPDGK